MAKTRNREDYRPDQTLDEDPLKKYPKPVGGVTWLNVPFNCKNMAKDAGAKWDKESKRWFVPEGKSLMNFVDWLPKEQRERIEYLREKYVEKQKADYIKANQRYESQKNKWVHPSERVDN